MKHGITLIAHREERHEEHGSYCAIYSHLSWEELEKRLHEYYLLNAEKDRCDREYEIDILIDGVPFHGSHLTGSMAPDWEDEEHEIWYNEHDTILTSLIKRVEEKVRVELETARINKQKLAEELQKKQEEQKRLFELKTLAELQAKYSNLK